MVACHHCLKGNSIMSHWGRQPKGFVKKKCKGILTISEQLKAEFGKGKSKENLEYQRAASKLYYIRRRNQANWENWNERERKKLCVCKKTPLTICIVCQANERIMMSIKA